MKTLLLDRSTWDLVIDISGNIAVASEPYSLAQDAASACQLFLGELWYDTTGGIPYWQQILGKWPPVNLMKAKWKAAALAVPDVESATIFVTSFKDRVFSAQLQITSTSGTATASFVTGVIHPKDNFIVNENTGGVIINDNTGDPILVQ